MSVDLDTKKSLDEVKKGKPRKFAMLCKGVNIVGLKVYKRGAEETHKKELKKEGNGQFYGGVITGRGEQIVFELLREQCDKAPVKDLVLKDFLSSEAGIKFRPSFELVAQLTPISEADQPAAEAEATPATEGTRETPAEGVDPAALWKQRAAGLAANLKQLKQNNVDLAKHPDITKFAKGAQEFAKRGDYAKAHKLMDEVDRQVAAALGESRRDEAGGAVATGRVKKQVYLRERWKQVPTELDASVGALRPKIGEELAGEVKNALKTLVDEIDEQIQDAVDQGAADFSGAIRVIQGARKQVQSNELIRHLESHPTAPDLGVESSFLTALEDLESKLAS